MKPDPKSQSRHAWRMAKQEIMRERIANADKDQGVLLVSLAPVRARAVPALAWWHAAGGTA